MKNNKKTLKIGVTGGIGSGKSYVCSVLEKMGFPVFYSDLVSKKMILENNQIKDGLIEIAGDQVFENKQLNKPYLANLIFHNDEIRKKVNDLIHPFVRQEFEKWASQQNATIVFNEAAILFETGSYQKMDCNILVTANLETKILRVMQRDSISREAVLERMSKQWDDETKSKLADFILINDDTKPLLEQIENVLKKVLEN